MFYLKPNFLWISFFLSDFPKNLFYRKFECVVGKSSKNVYDDFSDNNLKNLYCLRWYKGAYRSTRSTYWFRIYKDQTFVYSFI